MHVLLTGATGFIGFHVAAALLAAGHRVRALVRDPEKGQRVLGPLGLGTQDRVQGDMTDEAAVAKAIEGCEAVIHAAASVSVTAGAIDFGSNVRGTRVVLGAAIRRGLPSVYLSSLEAIMTPGEPVTESTPPKQAKTRYGQSKAEAERWVREQQAQGATIATVYPPGVVGPDDPGFSESVKAYRSFLRGTPRSGATQLVDARDLAALVVALLEKGYSGRVIAGGCYFTWDELSDVLSRVTGARIPRVPLPSWLLRPVARALDVVGRLTGRTMPITGEGVEIATRWQRVDDSKIVAELGIRWRDPAETLADLFRWYVKSGRLPAHVVPALAED